VRLSIVPESTPLSKTALNIWVRYFKYFILINFNLNNSSGRQFFKNFASDDQVIS
jgi:hypothetical protein